MFCANFHVGAQYGRPSFIVLCPQGLALLKKRTCGGK
jgi:hypothetical protein